MSKAKTVLEIAGIEGSVEPEKLKKAVCDTHCFDRCQEDTCDKLEQKWVLLSEAEAIIDKQKLLLERYELNRNEFKLRNFFAIELDKANEKLSKNESEIWRLTEAYKTGEERIKTLTRQIKKLLPENFSLQKKLEAIRQTLLCEKGFTKKIAELDKYIPYTENEALATIHKLLIVFGELEKVLGDS